MINKKKIVQMSKACVYDSGDGSREKEMVKYFKSDYIGREVTSSSIYMITFLVTIYLFKVGILILENDAIIDMDLIKKESTTYAVIALIILAIYMLVIVIIKSNEYDIAEKNVKKYIGILNSINKTDDGGKNE